MPRLRSLLINPPGARRYIRDGLCSQVARSSYSWQPLDLLIQSGWLAAAGDVTVVDAIAENRPLARCLDELSRERFDLILFLAGEKSHEEDRAFASAMVEQQPQAQLFGCGDVMFFRGEEPFREYRNLRGIVTHFAAGGLQAYLGGRRGRIPGLRYVDDSGDLQWELPVEGPLRYPHPLHTAFPRGAYRLPFGSTRPFASVLTSYGCPYRCSFCHLGQSDFLARPVEDVLDEMELLRRLGYRRLYIRDPTFAARRGDAHQLCEEMCRRGLRFEWNAFTRPDILDREILQSMADSGCAMLQLGLESPRPDTLRAHNKRLDPDRVRETVRLCASLGILTSGHFMVGLAGEDERDWSRIVDYARDLGCDYLALSMAEARLGVSLVGGDLETGIHRRRFLFDETKLARWIRRLNRRFYLRPSFVIGQLRRAGGLGGLIRTIDMARHLLVIGREPPIRGWDDLRHPGWGAAPGSDTVSGCRRTPPEEQVP